MSGACLQGPSAGSAMSEFLPNLRKTNITNANFPADVACAITAPAPPAMPASSQAR